ncbi:hypothetical protein UNDKW_3511 [Undibacterium sp. KW1]|uniref:DUF4194 domain-containing protein n=1 Tax=Undibacterium sp. KW1 TaxID=2058624 RepID=UPI001331E5E8|nr:DUF4194 domain-containing protein [Undibacterium sp. KW1]BBB61784.1 hypothetical protein UNDKW_3511 [Undibacterium sp. KW1]
MDTTASVVGHAATNLATPNQDHALSPLLINLLKTVLYREDDEQLWGALLKLQARVRDYVNVLNLDLVLDEAEGYAFLKSRPEPEEQEAKTRTKLPRLVARRPLSFPVSLLLALLRKRLAEFDANGGDTRLVLSKEDIAGLMRVFLPDSSNEARLVDQVETHINKVIDLGFIRKLKAGSSPQTYEVRRILKAFVDAQWLADFDVRLASYQAQLAGEEDVSDKTDE